MTQSKPYNNFDYLDPILIVWRSGKEDDPYVDRREYLKVVQHKVVLAEIPDRFTRVQIEGLEEVNVERVSAKELKENQFAVDYASGFILFHESHEAKTVNAKYKGRGFIQYPASRVYYQDNFNDVVLTLEDIIVRTKESYDKFNQALDEKLSDYYQVRDLLLHTIDESKKATDNANQAVDKANQALSMAEYASKTTLLIFRPYASSYYDMITKNPSPQVGWTVQVYDTGIRYRYDGSKWMPIDLFGGNIVIANDNLNGLMSKEDYKKLQALNDKVNMSKVEEKVLVFCARYLDIGINSLVLKFPYKGEIISIKAIASQIGTVITELDIEKSIDFNTWVSVLDNSYLTFDANSHADNGKHKILINDVAQNTLFRIRAKSLAETLEGISIEIKIRLVK